MEDPLEMSLHRLYLEKKDNNMTRCSFKHRGIRNESAGLDDRNLHSNCKADVCRPLGLPKQEVQGVEDKEKAATRLFQQIIYQLFSMPMAPQRTILARSAQPLSQKRTTFTQEY